MCEPPCGQARWPFRAEPQIKQNKPELLAHLHFLVVPQSILFHAKIKNKQTKKQTNKTKNYTIVWKRKIQMNIDFCRLFIKCFWWLLKQEAWKEKKNYTEQLLTFLWAYMYTIKNYNTSRKNKTNKQTNYTSSNQE